MWIPDFLLKFIGHKIEDKISLVEDAKMDQTKSWWQSKTIWSGVAAAAIGIYNAVGQVKGLPPIPDWVFTILGAIGIYSRVTAETKIG